MACPAGGRKTPVGSILLLIFVRWGDDCFVVALHVFLKASAPSPEEISVADPAGTLAVPFSFLIDPGTYLEAIVGFR